MTTFGPAGGNQIQWDLPGDEAVQIVVKAVRAGMTYLETANNYFLSQEKMGMAFGILNLKPGIDHSLRARLFRALHAGLARRAARSATTRCWNGSRNATGKSPGSMTLPSSAVAARGARRSQWHLPSAWSLRPGGLGA